LRFHDAVGKLASALPGGEFAGEANQESCMSAGSEFEQAPPSPPIQKAGVLGAGTMGARIAAHLANAGLAVVLLDIPSDGTARSAVAARGLDSLRKAKPAAFYDPAFATRITTGNFADDLTLLSDCDWVIEAVTEDLAIKRSLLEKVAPHLKPGAIFSTNTSGLPVAQIGAVLPEGLRARWLGTHFFNPPRYMRLLEMIATPETAAPVRRRHRLCGRAPGQGSSGGARHAQLHRQPPRRVPDAGNGAADAGAEDLSIEEVDVTDRHRHRLSADRDFPPGGYGGN
jgi:hypothetical protein